MSFDFDHWMELAQQDPDGFESLRSKAITKWIDQEHADNRRKLEGLQFRLDMECRMAKTPMGACLHLSRKMMDYVHEQFLPALVEMAQQQATGLVADDDKRGQVIPFPAEPPK